MKLNADKWKKEIDVTISPIILSLIFSTLVLIYSSTSLASPPESAIPLRSELFEHIRFGKIKANQFDFTQDELHIAVNDSSSFLMLPFDKVKMINGVRFKWRTKGEMLIRDAEHESNKDGDDATFKLGLLLKTDNESFSFFAPSWLKKVRDQLKYPSEDMIDLIANAKHASGEQWFSPYNDRVTMISVKSMADKDGWWLADHGFEKPVEVVAIWLMADGDNTHSKFITRVKNIVLR